MKLIHALQDNSDPNSLVSRFRRARSRRVVALIEAIHAEKGAVRIIDLGGEANYWRLFDLDLLKSRNVMIGQIATAYYFLHFLLIVPIVCGSRSQVLNAAPPLKSIRMKFSVVG